MVRILKPDDQVVSNKFLVQERALTMKSIRNFPDDEFLSLRTTPALREFMVKYGIDPRALYPEKTTHEINKSINGTSKMHILGRRSCGITPASHPHAIFIDPVNVYKYNRRLICVRCLDRYCVHRTSEQIEYLENLLHKRDTRAANEKREILAAKEKIGRFLAMQEFTKWQKLGFLDENGALLVDENLIEIVWYDL